MESVKSTQGDVMGPFTAEADLPNLYTLEGEVAEEQIEKYFIKKAVESRGDKGVVTLAFRSPSTVTVGKPIAYPLADLLAESGQDVPPDIRLQLPEYDFCRAELACSFHPSEHSRFIDAQKPF
jgi:hypothetical protein